MEIRIADKLIGGNNPCFIIAEAGVNHNGSLGLARQLVDAAKEAGADCVKFQTFKAKDLVTKQAPMAPYQESNIDVPEFQQPMLEKLELSHSHFEFLKNYCVAQGIMFMSTPHTEAAVDFLDHLVPAYKIGSGDLTNIPLLVNAASRGKPVILSVGMGTMSEINEAVTAMQQTGNKDIILLHCTSVYPTPPREVNLRAMVTIREEIGTVVGYSDHTTSVLTPALAVAMGANVIEKHFTLDKQMEGPDHKSSLNPEELKQMVVAVRYTETVMGSASKHLTESERVVINVVRKSIVSAVDIPKGIKITEEMLIIKRPGTGIPPKELGKVLGLTATRDITKDTLLSYEDLV